MPLDPATADLLRAIHDAVSGMADWRTVAVTSAVQSALVDRDPAAAADWLRGFLAQREKMEELAAEPAHAVWGYDWLPEPPEGTTS